MGKHSNGQTARETIGTKNSQLKLAVVACMSLTIPMVQSFCAPPPSCFHKKATFSNRWASTALPWTSSTSRSTITRSSTRGGDFETNLSRGMRLRMQDGAGYGGGGEGRQGSTWNSQRTYSDGFGEGIPRLNTVFLTGYLGQDPKPKYFDSGKVVLNLSLAVKREYHPIERKALGVVYGEEETDWFQLEMWNRDAEYAAKVCKKGGRVGVTGGLSLNAWVDREGRDRTTAKILVQNLELLDSRAEHAQRSDSSDANLWESERLQKSDAAALRQQGAGGVGPSGGATGGGMLGGDAYQQQSAEELAAKARKKEMEDKWWSTTPEVPSATPGGDGAGSGEYTAAKGNSRESTWWEDEGGDGSTNGIDSDSLPSFFDS